MPAPYALIINGSPVTDALVASLHVQRAYGKRSYCELTLKTEPTVGHSVGVYDGEGTRIFGGSIDSVSYRPIEKAAIVTVLYEVACTSYDHRLDNRVVASRAYGQVFAADPVTNTLTSNGHNLSNDQAIQFSTDDTLPSGLATETTAYVIGATTDTFQVSASLGGAAIDITDAGTGTHWFLWQTGNIIRHLVANDLNGEQITVGGVQDGVFSEKLVYEVKKASEVVDELARLSDYIWYVSPDTDLFFGPKTLTQAPFQITDESSIIGPRLRSTREQYATRIYSQFGWGAIGATEETFNGDDSTQRWWLNSRAIQVDEVLLNGESISFAVGGASGANLGPFGSDIPEPLTANEAFFWSPGEYIFWQNPFDTPLGPSDALTIRYRALGENIALRMNEAEETARGVIEGASGIYSKIFDDSSNTNAQAVLDKADAELDQVDEIAKVLEYTVIQNGLAPGQLQTVTLTGFGLTAIPFVIDSISTESSSKFAGLRHSVTLVSITRFADWVDYFKSLGKPKPAATTTLFVGARGTSEGIIAYV